MTITYASMDANWNRMMEITHSLFADDNNLFGADRTSRNEWQRYQAMLEDLKQDHAPLLGMFRAPGSINRHHNVEGGLVAHLLQMWEVWAGSMRFMLRDQGATHPLLTDRNVWKCILHHDMNKVWKYKLVSSTPWKVEYGDKEDSATYLLGDVHKSLFMLAKHGIHLTLPLHNALITAEGGYSQGPRPKTESVLAKVAYLLDDTSANVIDRLQTNRFWDSKDGGMSGI